MSRIATTTELASISEQPAFPGSNASVIPAGLGRVAQEVSVHNINVKTETVCIFRNMDVCTSNNCMHSER